LIDSVTRTFWKPIIMHSPPGLPILYEDNHLLVVSKPVGLVTQGAAAGRTSVLDLARAYLKQKYDKPGNVYLGIVSRLDASSTGVLVLARTSKAAGRLAEQFRAGRVEKTYWAVVQGHPEPASGECVDWIMKDDRLHRMIVTQPSHRLAQQARLTYRTRVTLERETLLEIDLQTGRKHQIRVQLAHRGHPILGDTKYGATTGFPAGIALHARRLVIEHPVRREPLVIQAPCPASWRRLGIDDSFLA
jgi:23S rRNA pseudouridine1911/1915/1917 synthase